MYDSGPSDLSEGPEFCRFYGLPFLFDSIFCHLQNCSGVSIFFTFSASFSLALISSSEIMSGSRSMSGPSFPGTGMFSGFSAFMSGGPCLSPGLPCGGMPLPGGIIPGPPAGGLIFCIAACSIAFSVFLNTLYSFFVLLCVQIQFFLHPVGPHFRFLYG